MSHATTGVLEGKRVGDDLQAKNIRLMPARGWPALDFSPTTDGPTFSECALMLSPCVQSCKPNWPYSIPQAHMGISMPISQQACLASKSSLGCRQRVSCLLCVIWWVWVFVGKSMAGWGAASTSRDGLYALYNNILPP